MSCSLVQLNRSLLRHKLLWSSQASRLGLWLHPLESVWPWTVFTSHSIKTMAGPSFHLLWDFCELAQVQSLVQARVGYKVSQLLTASLAVAGQGLTCSISSSTKSECRPLLASCLTSSLQRCWRTEGRDGSCREKGREEGNGGLDLCLLSTECGDRRDGPCFIVLPACRGHSWL